MKKETVALSPSRIDQANTGDSGDRIDTIRNLLFGEQSEYFENKIDVLKDDLDHELSDLRSSLSERMDSLDRLIKEEFKSINTKINNETKSRTRANAKMVDTFSEENTFLKTQAADMEKALSSALEATKEGLSDDLKKEVSAIRKELEKTSANLSKDIDLHVRKADLSSAFEAAAESFSAMSSSGK